MDKNKLIAEFMCYYKYELQHGFTDEKPNMIDYYKISEVPKNYGNEDWHNEISLRFDTSWDWLIPVIEKIESLDLSEWMYKWEGMDGETNYNFEGISVEIENTRCWIYINLSLDPYWTINEKTFNIKHETKLKAVYEAVVEFIEWYNERKQREEGN